MNRHTEAKREADAPAELESQFILRLPEEPAKVLRDALQSGVVHLKDRMSVKLENDMRYGEVRVDHWLLRAKVVDLPTVVESLKTIDGKSFYKTADVCQLVICKEEDDQTTTDEESPAKTKKKDPNKVDKKFLYPHGITPPMKNVRRRRFRKTLKKKYVEAPEIEKEVKRLLRVDNDAVHVKWEIISEDDDKSKIGEVVVKEEINTLGDASLSLEASNQQSVDVAEHDIFGGAVSDSEEETNINIMELEDETSRPSADDSRLSDTSSLQGLTPTSSQRPLVTQFSKEMFSPRSRPSSSIKRELGAEFSQSIKSEPSFDFDLMKSELSSDEAGFVSQQQMTRTEIQMRLDALEQQLMDFGHRRQQLELEISSMDNYALRQRFQDNLDNLMSEQMDKEIEHQELTSLLQLQ